MASIGVHLRRRVTSHGVGLNVDVDLGWFERIVACGLLGKKATNMVREMEGMGQAGKDGQDAEELAKGLRNEGRAVSVGKVAGVFADVVAKRLDGVEGTLKSEMAMTNETNLDELDYFVHDHVL